MPPAHLSQLLWREFASQTREHGLMFLDPDGRIVGWAGAAREILGYEEEEVLGAPGALIFTPEDVARGLDRQELEVARRALRSQDDRWHVRKDGTRIWASGSVDVIRGAAGEVLGFVKIVRDRTDARMETQALRNELEAMQAARDRMLAFIRTLGHEMRNPLGPLLNSAHILRRLGGDPRIGQAADIIANQVAALGRMAEDLMNVARMDSGQLELRTELLDLRQVVESAVAGFSGAARERGVALQVIVPGAPLEVRLDRARFEQVLLNLLGNALKYTPRGGHVGCKASRAAQEVLLRIEDTGIGIAPEMLPRIFELFSRERQAVEREPGGLGVGLSIAHQIVKLHGGSIQARSAGHGRGAEFTIRLPAATRS